MAVKVTGIGAILLDIEGTVCGISFVKDVLFPYALTTLETNIDTLWNSASFHPYLDAFPESSRSDPNQFLSYIRSLMSTDSKSAPFKNLQGYLWLSGYESGALRCPLFPDVAPMLQKWNANGLKIFIYSSGSVAAQKLLFQYTDSGNLQPLLSGFFDTISAGVKNESSSYSRIIAESSIEDEELKNFSSWLFCSDSVAEVDAALAAGMKSFIVAREGNAPLSNVEQAQYKVIQSIAQLEINGLDGV